MTIIVPSQAQANKNLQTPLPSSTEGIVLVLTPTGRDAEGACMLMSKASIPCQICPDFESLYNSINEETGVVLIAEEAISDKTLSLLVQRLEEQPVWSDLPIIVLTGPSANKINNQQALIQLSHILGNIMFLERPLYALTLISAARSALNARKRQYQNRDYLREKDNAVAALKASEERYSRVINASRDGFWDWDILAGQEVFWSDRLYEMLGYTRETFNPSYNNFFNLIHPDDREVIQDRLQAHLDDPNIRYDMEYRILHADGGYRYFHGRGEAVRDSNGKALLMSGIISDVTARKQAEENLKESEARFRSMADAAQTFIWMTDENHNLVYLNTSFRNYVGLEPDNDDLNAWQSYPPAEELPLIQQAMSDSAKTRIPFRMEHRLKRPDGSWGWMIATGTPRYTETGEFKGFIGANMDITEEKRAQAAVHKAFDRERTLRRIAEINSQTLDIDAILKATAEETGKFFQVDRCIFLRYTEEKGTFVTNTTCQYLADNDIPVMQAEEMPFKMIPIMGRKLNEKHPTVFARYSSPEEYLEQMHAKLKSTKHAFNEKEVLKQFKEYTQKYIIRSGLGVEIHYRGIPFGAILLHQCRENRIWREAEIILLAHIATNIGAALYQSDLFQQEQHARQQAELANQKKSEFLAMMSHELRTPLNAILGYSHMLGHGMVGSVTEKQAQYASHIEMSGKHLLSIINDLLDVSRIEAGKLVISPVETELSPIVEEVQSLMQELAHAKAVSLDFYLEDGVNRVEADPTRLKQVLVNLVSNGIKFNRQNGTVFVKLTRDSDYLCCEVRDTGLGIPKEKISELFQKFYQIDASASRPHEGTGLGLVLTKHLIELHGGEITVDSVEGEGSVFRFKIPFEQSNRSFNNTDTNKVTV